MADAPLRLFISYSRTDSDFVDTLQADLQARNFDAWVDRRRLEGGRDWAQTIEAAIDRSQVVLVVLSPDALNSEWVRREYSYAQDNAKRVVPLRYRDISKAPMRLSELQWVDFNGRYDQGVRDLLVALTPIAAIPLPPPQPPTIAADTDPSDLVEIRAAPPQPNANLHALYRAGLEANVDGDLERAAVLWGQVLDQDPTFEAGLLSQQVEALKRNLQPIRVQRLRERARTAARDDDWRQAAGAWRALLDIEPEDAQAQSELRDALRKRATKARAEGLWGEEIGAYEALLKLEPNEQSAQEYLPIAERNLQWAYKYQSARDFLQAGKPAAARAELELLWGQAPYYGDPSNIAPEIGVAVPPSYDEVKAAQRKAEEEAHEASRKQALAEEAAREISRQQKSQVDATAKQRAEAETKHRDGAWADEIAAWKKVLEIKPDDAEARERIPIAEWNQRAASTYAGIVSSVKAGLTYLPTSQLRALWKAVPYYGDPQGVAPKLNLTAPPTFEEVKRTDPAQIQRNNEARNERALLVAQVAEGKRKDLFIKYNLGTQAWQVFTTTLCLLFALGCYSAMIAPIVTASGSRQVGGCAVCATLFPQLSVAYGVAAVLVFGVLLYMIAFRSAYRIGTYLVGILVASALVYLIARFVHPVPNAALNWQLAGGAIIGSLAGLLSLGVISSEHGDAVSRNDDGSTIWTIGYTLIYGFGAVILWLIVAGIGTIFHWEISFYTGWQYGLLGGLGLALVFWMGFIAFLIVLIPGLQQRFTEFDIPMPTARKS